VTNAGSKSVSVIDTGTNAVSATVRVGVLPVNGAIFCKRLTNYRCCTLDPVLCRRLMHHPKGSLRMLSSRTNLIVRQRLRGGRRLALKL
jgi:YVTN family beta-propeller protein